MTHAPNAHTWPEPHHADDIGQNGNDGQHHDTGRETVSTTAVDDQAAPAVSNDEVLKQAFEKQQRYQDANGDDWIDEFARTSTPEEFRGAMRFTIGKYERRLGKKDPIPMELRKMADYYLRWAEFEEARK